MVRIFYVKLKNKSMAFSLFSLITIKLRSTRGGPKKKKEKLDWESAAIRRLVTSKVHPLDGVSSDLHETKKKKLNYGV